MKHPKQARRGQHLTIAGAGEPGPGDAEVAAAAAAAAGTSRAARAGASRAATAVAATTAALDYLRSRERFGVRLGLERMAFLLERLGHPERAFPCVHVTGTNGKGSVSRLVAGALQAAGYRVGLYTSPHLVRYEERIRLAGRMITPAQLMRAIQPVQRAAEAAEAAGLEPATEFEVGTAAMYAFFRDQGIDVLVQEAGLGGRYDSTNLVPPPEVCVVTNVSLDHTDRLGTDVALIAAEKAGIFKRGSCAVSAARDTVARRVLDEVAASLRIPLALVGRDWSCRPNRLRPAGSWFTYEGKGGRLDNVFVRLAGAHQVENAGTALAVLEALEGRGWAIGEAAIRRAFATVRWPGRLDHRRRPVELLLDGAHNPAGGRALAQALAELYPGRPLVLLAGALADKDVHGIFRPLAALSPRVVCCEPSDTPRRLPAQALADSLRQLGMEVVAAAPFPQAWELALREVRAAGAAQRRGQPAGWEDRAEVGRGAAKPAGPEAVLRRPLRERSRQRWLRQPLQQPLQEPLPADEPLLVVTGSLYVVGEVEALLRVAAR